MNIFLTVVIVIIIIFSSFYKSTNQTYFGYSIYTIVSGSMSPNIPVGTLVISKKIPFELLNKGDVISYTHDQHDAVTHRVVSISDDKKTITTKGDSLNSIDPIKVTEEMYLGKKVFQIKHIGSIFLKLKSVQGKISFIGFCLSILIFNKVVSYIKQYKELKSKLVRKKRRRIYEKEKRIE